MEPSSIAACHSASQHRRRWCADNGITPLTILTPADFCHFLQDLLLAGYCYATANHSRSYVALVNALHQSPSPTDSPLVTRALIGYKKASAAWSQRRAAITADLLRQLHAWVDTHLHTVIHLPHPLQEELTLELHAFYETAYGGLLRREEAWNVDLTALRPLPTQGTRIYLPRSKTDPYHHGAEVLINSDPYLRQLCARRSGCTGRLWRIMTPQLALGVIRRALPGGPYVIHSLRHGRATDMLRAGFTLHQIMTAGRWQSLGAVRLYLHRAPQA